MSNLIDQYKSLVSSCSYNAGYLADLVRNFAECISIEMDECNECPIIDYCNDIGDIGSCEGVFVLHILNSMGVNKDSISTLEFDFWDTVEVDVRNIASCLRKCGNTINLKPSLGFEHDCPPACPSKGKCLKNLSPKIKEGVIHE